MLNLPTEPAIVHGLWAIEITEGDGYPIMPWQRRLLFAAFRGEPVRYPTPLPRRHSYQWWHSPAECR